MFGRRVNYTLLPYLRANTVLRGLLSGGYPLYVKRYVEPITSA